MKKFIFVSCIGIFLSIAGLSFKPAIDKTNAIAETKEGLTIFHFSKPGAKYDVLGKVKLPAICSDRSDERVKILIERAKKEFPSGEAIIANDAFGIAEVIKFKE